jgi:DNA-binding CsgD family transcriptional regulator
MQELAIELALESAATVVQAERELELARTWLEARERLVDWSGAVRARAATELLRARYLRACGERESARERAGLAVELASEPRQAVVLIDAHRLLGELAAEAGEFDAAQHELDESLRLAQACRFPYEQGLVHLAAAELGAATGDSAAAHARLEEARAILDPLEARPALARLDALDEALARQAGARLPTASTARPLRYPAGLTAREVEVLRLIATGTSNREIADQLGLSLRTVERHISNIYIKIDATSKSSATAFAYRHDLV